MIGLKIVDDYLNKAFYKLGFVVGKHPGYFIIVPILLTCLGMTGYQKMHNNIDPEYLFSPLNGEGKQERSIVEQYFKVNYTSRFNVARITRAGRFGRVIITSKDGIKNMLRTDVWKEMRQLDDLIQNMTVHFQEEQFNYSNICAKWMDECFQNDILNLEYIMDEVEAGERNLTFPLTLNTVTFDVHALPVFFGGTEVSEDGLVISVPSVQLVYFGNADNKKIDALGGAWEEGFLNLIEQVQDIENRFKHIRIARFASKTLDHELEKNARSVIPYFTSTFVIMAIFSVVTCMMTDWVRSKPWLGLLGNISAAMATLCAFGICMYADVDFIGINLAAPFLMIGVGIDDTFVMLAAWRRTSIKTPVPQRMAEMLGEAAVSITITSVTDFFSFGIGIFSPFPSVTIFCIYSGAATLLLFIWHLTFFAGCVAVSGYCEQKNLHSVFCFKVEPVSLSEDRCWLYKVFCSGGVNPNDMDNPKDNTEHGLMVFFRDYFAVFLSNGFVKVLVILIFGCYLAGAGYGVTQIEEGLERRKVAKNGSYAIEFFDREDDYYREFPYRVQVIVAGEYDYSDPKIQAQIENLTRTFENTSYITNSLYTESWLRSFLQYVDRNADYLNISINSRKNFMEALEERKWLDPSSAFSLDVKFDEKNEKIIAMRFLIQAVNISGTEHEKEMVRALRKICKDSPLNVTVFHPYFVFFDQFELVRPLTIQNVLIGGGIMMIVSFIFIPNVFCAVWVAFSIISIELGVIGYMALWKVNLDSISMINIIMCIGFSVDFTAHICYSYMSSTEKTPNEKMRMALYSLGLPIFQGSVSTILGVLALILANNYIFAVFFKMIFLVVFLGAMHGLFLLPVLLSLFGPGSCSSPAQDDDVKMSSIEKSLPHPYCIPHPRFTLNGSNLKPSDLMPVDYLKKPIKGFGEMEKDLGLGTSEENSSQSSTHSNKKPRGEMPPKDVGRQYGESWRRGSDFHLNQYRPRHIDIYGTELYRPRDEEVLERYNGGYNTEDRRQQHQRWRYSPTEHGNFLPNAALVRSSSYHNVLHPRFLKESRFP
ncbi:patched domain-containing protein 3 [Dendroctonus ponderosae]|uniref:patched domain-containing protein 3 n=1 Tax=Dendroctonus ponderosae TaxID=77166 RepID=UPI002035CA7E|nr:patched domain-containing protein 3 [Dendroctonus ponderosae]